MLFEFDPKESQTRRSENEENRTAVRPGDQKPAPDQAPMTKEAIRIPGLLARLLWQRPPE